MLIDVDDKTQQISTFFINVDDSTQQEIDDQSSIVTININLGNDMRQHTLPNSNDNGKFNFVYTFIIIIF